MAIKNILIVLPYGDFSAAEKRREQLRAMLECLGGHIKKRAADKSMRFFIIVAEQVTPVKYFNRGQVANIAFLYFKRRIGQPSHMLFHDVDMLPNDELFEQYLTPRQSLCMIPSGSPTFRKTYGFELTTGSAVYLTTPEAFIKANGFPNNFWGWGGEDNALHVRYTKKNMPLERNTRGDYTSLDVQRQSNKEKMDHLKQNAIRNMYVWELIDAEKKGAGDTDGYAQMDDIHYEILSEEVKELDNLRIIHLRLKLDEATFDPQQFVMAAAPAPGFEKKKHGRRRSKNRSRGRGGGARGRGGRARSRSTRRRS